MRGMQMNVKQACAAALLLLAGCLEDTPCYRCWAEENLNAWWQLCEGVTDEDLRAERVRLNELGIGKKQGAYNEVYLAENERIVKRRQSCPQRPTKFVKQYRCFVPGAGKDGGAGKDFSTRKDGRCYMEDAP